MSRDTQYTLGTSPDWSRSIGIVYAVKALRNWTGCSLVEAKNLIDTASVHPTSFYTDTPLTPDHKSALSAAGLVVEVVPVPEDYAEKVLLELVHRLLADDRTPLAEKILHQYNEVRLANLLTRNAE